MILKEAFRYQNYLTSLINYALDYLSCDCNMMSIKQEHMRKKINPSAENETIDILKNSTLEYTPNQVIDFLMEVLSEKEKLTKAIDAAKNKSESNMDSAMAMNKVKQNIVNILDGVARKKSSERLTKGTDYKFNAEGNQITYIYEVKEITTIDFDRNKVKGIIKKLNKETDEVSYKRDRLDVELEVNYSPSYDVNDTFEDAIDTFVNSEE